jgi:Flp pilus assembly protein TadB
MVPVMSLWLPILVSAVLVFVASSIIHMVLGYHRADYRKVPKEDDTMDALRNLSIAPGDYMVPCPTGPSAMKDPAFLEKMKRGPIVLMTVLPGSSGAMGAQLVQWFIYCTIVSVFAAYVSGRALGPGAEYLNVFRFAGTTAFIAYSVALWQTSIWYKKSWGTTLRQTIDGLVYGLLTGGAFGWLWPR